MRNIKGQTVYLLCVIACSCLLGTYMLLGGFTDPALQAQPSPSKFKLEEIPFDGQQAYDYLKTLCALGPRSSGSETMLEQRKLLVKHFEGLGAKVEEQAFVARHPLDDSRVPMANLVIHWHPDRKQRIMLSAHYDTRPYPDRDPLRPQGTFLGANDGASGTGLLMELGRHMPDLEGKLGVDFVLFDGEELVFDERGDYFLGSTWFAEQYAQSNLKKRGYEYKYGVLLDMVGDADLQLYEERASLRARGVRPLIDKIWGTAKRLGVREFIARPKHELRDDHLPLNNIARIPTCDVIDFDYDAWHTEADVADRCSALSLAKVGWVLHEWLKTAVH